MKTLIWLDDYRNPFKDDWLIFSPINPPYDVKWIKNYYDFCKYIISNGLPDGICFDHDLGCTKTGYDCAKFIVEYCFDHNKSLPEYNCQSANPVGRENITKLFENYKKHYPTVNQ